MSTELNTNKPVEPTIDMNKAPEDIIPMVDELTTLKARADMMGVTYHPSIGVEKLREKVMNAINSVEDTEEVDELVVEDLTQEAPVQETDMERRNRKRREANELVRIVVSCMNPAKKEWEGEIFTVGNSVVGSFTKFVPFNVEDGWHVPRIIYNIIKERQCQIFVSDNKNGRASKMIKEFSVAVLDQLTPEELHKLAQRQAMASGE